MRILKILLAFLILFGLIWSFSSKIQIDYSQTRQGLLDFVFDKAYIKSNHHDLKYWLNDKEIDDLKIIIERDLQPTESKRFNSNNHYIITLENQTESKEINVFTNSLGEHLVSIGIVRFQSESLKLWIENTYQIIEK
jgi:hypothetical protein